ncbi:hypothetical protein EG68_11318 [Paragonimus skrjabini miyazakii]|uniref:DUF4806 domain-containing protein n=1 Tax=Paragonimus skrjabini miyazakii TaxID=59628 RepID=A0A8S9YEX8_9TREM|nr:hypothetical protein EG68_11318 [Paragonimus skrjabini miyazakii]
MWGHLRGCPEREPPSIVMKCGVKFIGEPCCSYVPDVVADTEVDIVPVSTTTVTSLGGPSNRKPISKRILRPWKRSNCTSRLTNLDKRYSEKKAESTPHLSTLSVCRVPLRYSSDDDCDHRESQEKKSSSRRVPSMYYDPPLPQFPQLIMLHSPQRSPIAEPSTVRLPVFHDLPPPLTLKGAAVRSTFCASRSEILSPFSPRMATNTSSSKSVCTSNSKPAVMPAMFRSSARTQEDQDAREAELANSEMYDVVMKSRSRIGGTDVTDAIRRMMSFLIHNDLAVSMNWSGVCNKREACELLSMELVRGHF